VASRDQGEAVEAEEPATEDETSRIKDLIAALACPLMGVGDPAGGSTVGGNEPRIIGALAPTATASAATACAAAVPAEAPSGATGAMAGGQRGDPSTPRVRHRRALLLRPEGGTGLR
jgi:hypothetical protein